MQWRGIVFVMMSNRRAARIYLAPFLCAAFCGCLSLTENVGQIADGSAFAEKTILRWSGKGLEAALVESKDDVDTSSGKKQELLITLEEFPFLEFRASAPISTPSAEDEVSFISLRYLVGTAAGWNEWTRELSGFLTFRRIGNIAYISLESPLMAGAVIEGKILHNGEKRAGAEAVSSLSARADRVAALSTWMRLHTEERSFPNAAAFYAYWRPILFPELVRARYRPALYTETAAKEPSKGAVADIRWNAAYTAALLPEELRPLRDSGALLRDWEEAPDWIYAEYEWARIENLLRVRQLLEE